MGIRASIWWEALKASIRSQKGQGMVEYGLILALVSLSVIAAVTLMGNNVGHMFNNAAANLNK